MKILLLGNNGQVGWELQRTLLPLGELIAIDYPQIDLVKTSKTRDYIRRYRPNIIINATAYTNVDQAEKEPDIAYAVNATAPAILAEEAKKLNAALIHYSTDFVFDGEKGDVYHEGDIPAPINRYGESKLSGERAIQELDGTYLILRTSWVYSLRRSCFVTNFLDWAKKNPVLRIVTDQVSNPTWSRSLAEITAQILAQERSSLVDWLAEKKGLYHLAGKGYVSKLDWAREILEHTPLQDSESRTKLLPASSSEFQTLAKRPKFSALNCELFEKKFGLSLPNWKTDLALAMEK